MIKEAIFFLQSFENDCTCICLHTIKEIKNANFTWSSFTLNINVTKIIHYFFVYHISPKGKKKKKRVKFRSVHWKALKQTGPTFLVQFQTGFKHKGLKSDHCLCMLVVLILTKQMFVLYLKVKLFSSFISSVCTSTCIQKHNGD